MRLLHPASIVGCSRIQNLMNYPCMKPSDPNALLCVQVLRGVIAIVVQLLSLGDEPSSAFRVEQDFP